MIVPHKEYNITDTHNKKLKKASVAHEYSKKSNVVGKKYTTNRGWKTTEEPATFTVAEGSGARLSDMIRKGGVKNDDD